MRNFDESYEQLIGDLDALGYLEIYSKHPGLSQAQQQAVREYIETFRNFDDRPFVNNGTVNVETLLASSQWRKLEAKAQQLVSLFPKK